MPKVSRDTIRLRPSPVNANFTRVFSNRTTIMNKTTVLFALAAVTLGLSGARAGDVTGTVTLKGTPPKEREITPLKEDANCGKLHADMPTTHFYVVGDKGELADVIVSIEGAGGKSAGA